MSQRGCKVCVVSYMKIDYSPTFFYIEGFICGFNMQTLLIDIESHYVVCIGFKPPPLHLFRARITVFATKLEEELV